MLGVERNNERQAEYFLRAEWIAIDGMNGMLMK